MNRYNLLCLILLCINISALIIACLAFTKQPTPPSPPPTPPPRTGGPRTGRPTRQRRWHLAPNSSGIANAYNFHAPANEAALSGVNDPLICTAGTCYGPGGHILGTGQQGLMACCCTADGKPCDSTWLPGAGSVGCGTGCDKSPGCMRSGCKPQEGDSICMRYGHGAAGCACNANNGFCSSKWCGQTVGSNAGTAIQPDDQGNLPGNYKKGQTLAAGQEVCCKYGDNAHPYSIFGEAWCANIPDWDGTSQDDQDKCAYDDMCANDSCVNGHCVSNQPIGGQCDIDNDCGNDACGRESAADGTGKTCCKSSDNTRYAGYDYCMMMPNGTTCWSDNMCASYYCGGNMGGIQRGTCSTAPTSSCIANSQLIDTKTKGLITIKDLKPGDYINNGEYYDLVYFIQEHEGEFEVLNIHLGDDILKLTSEHLVYLGNQMICAGSLNTGDKIQGQTIKNITTTVESVRNPMTISGKLLLGEIVASCYTHSEEHAKKLQKLKECFDFEKLTEELGSDKVQELVNTIYNKLANETFRKDRIMKPLPQMITV